MPKIVDHEERRMRIAAALLRLVSREGTDAVSLRHVAAEAGVTAGMVQHYFASKDAMMHFAMRTASARYEERIAADLARLGDDPAPREIVAVLLGSLLPADEGQLDDARIGLAFQSYAATNPDAAEGLAMGNAQLREHIASLLDQVGTTKAPAAATALIAAAEGLAVHVVSSQLPLAEAHAALALLLDTYARGR